ncbi:MAG: hypothetical protein FJY98_03615 [Candidatus Liptonbacteria bacterium]|nr:hypothetical protein [Candidatus Liptonbacteria bacterium]
METEIKTCQNCKRAFQLNAQDFDFFKKLKIPAPTFCFDCRVQRRMAYRNERTLYKRTCQAPGHNEQMISIFSPDNPQRVYCHKEWWGNNWDASTYARDVDFSKPFFTQLKELWTEVPDIALLNINPVNSEYCSITEGNKNCYLVFGGDFNENTLYSTYSFTSKECADTYWISKCEFNYETVDCISCSRLLYSRYCDGCYNSAFLFNCYNCHDCLGCVNLKNKSYCIFNEQYTKEEYLEKIKEFDISNVASVQKIRERFEKHKLDFPRRFARMVHATNSTGDNLEQTKNCKYCFDVFGGAEDCVNTWLAYSKVQDSMDVDRVGKNTELGYECSTIYPGSKVFFSRFTFDSHDIYYSYNNHNCSYLFGCVGMRNKQYCILNKQYSKEEYEAMVPQLIEHMEQKPYIDKKGRIYKFGEFFPAELSPFAYNETIAQEMFPITKEQASAEGYIFKEAEDRHYEPTKTSAHLPRTIAEVPDSIVNEIIQCEHNGACTEQCTKAFKIIQAELQFYRQMNIPLPRLCPSCRHYARLRQRNPIKLWKRKCACSGQVSENGVYKNSASHSHGNDHCEVSFETSYAPDRPETVYCETCYQAEVS